MMSRQNFPAESDNFCEQPGTNERRDNGTDEAEWKPPANKRLCDEADDRRNDQVHEKVEAERPDIVTQLNGDTICQNKL
jgi:hypothetical protein